MRIAFLSDTHLTPAAPAFDHNMAVIRDWIAANGIAHTIHLGDVSADGADVSEQLEYACDGLADWPGTLHVLPGNHDVGDNPGTPGHLVADPARIARYARLFGPDHWGVAVSGWTLIGLNAQLCGRADDLERRQEAWLSETVAQIRGPAGLCLHKPLFRNRPDDGDRHHRYVPPEARRLLLAHLAKVDVRFVISGHTHQTRRFHNDGIEHVWTPSAAFTLPDGMQEKIGVKEVGIMLLTLDGQAYRFERIIPDGLAQNDLADHAHVYPAHAETIRAAGRASD